MKWFSRKFFVFLLIFFTASAFKYLNKLQDLYYTVLIIFVAVTYLFINADLKIKTMRLSFKGSKIEAENTCKKNKNNL